MESLLSKLKKYELPYQVNGQHIAIDLGSSQEISLLYTETGSVKITDRLTAWNPLTGILRMSVKGSIIFNVIGSVVLMVLFIYMDRQQPNNAYVLIGVGLVAWLVLWTNYYHVRAEHFKRQLIDWLEAEQP